jgi:hypothetical protein
MFLPVTAVPALPGAIKTPDTFYCFEPVSRQLHAHVRLSQGLEYSSSDDLKLCSQKYDYKPTYGKTTAEKDTRRDQPSAIRENL